jgi:hypothetical protein
MRRYRYLPIPAVAAVLALVSVVAGDWTTGAGAAVAILGFVV